MKTSSTVLVFTLVICLALSLQPFARTTSEPRVRESMIVSTEWLAQHLNDPSLVLLQVGTTEEYVAGHIAGAQFITLSDISLPRGPGLRLELPPVEKLKTAFEKLGVSNDSRMIVYFSKDWVTPTARVFMTLAYLGLGNQTSILDGGLPAWRAEDRPVTTAVKEPRSGRITPHTNSQLVVDATWVSTHLKNPNVMILDARAAEYFSGAEAGQMPRTGHIPGAKNIPFSTLVQDSNNKFKKVAALRELFHAAGVKERDSVVTYCHIGQQASLLYFAARYLGYDAHVYDGSFEDWSRRTELPVETSSDPNVGAAKL